MQSSHVLALSILISAGAAAGMTFALRHEPAPPAPAVSPDELEKTVAELRESLAAMRAELQQKAVAPAGSDRTLAPQVSDEQVEAAVRRYFQSRGGAMPAEAVAANEPFDAAAAFAQLRDKDAWEDPAAWKKIQEAGHMDAVIAEFEKRAKANPNDIQAQMELANAYMAALQFDQTKWPLSIKADKAWDQVLEVDPQHWEARFRKAVSYSFWPDFLGKKQEAITHFERLVEQQKNMPSSPGHAETYLFLGNLLDQRGERDKALAIWRQGFQRHPDSQELRRRLGQ